MATANSKTRSHILPRFQLVSQAPNVTRRALRRGARSASREGLENACLVDEHVSKKLGRDALGLDAELIVPVSSRRRPIQVYFTRELRLTRSEADCPFETASYGFY